MYWIIFYLKKEFFRKLLKANQSMRKNLLVYIFLLGLVFFYTNGIFNTYFQQDEWNGFGTVIRLKSDTISSWFNILGTIHFIPLSQFFWYLMYFLFGFDARYYVFTSLFLHATASFFVYLFLKKINNNFWIALLCSVLFATNAKVIQVYTHLAIFPATTTSFLIILLSLLYISHLSKKYFSPQNFLVIVLLFITGVFLREDAMMLILLIPGFLFFYKKESFNKKNIWFYCGLFLVFTAFVGFRFYLQQSNTNGITMTSVSFLTTYIYNLFTFPYKLVTQSVFDVYPLFVWSLNNISRLYGFDIPFVVIEKIFFEYVFLVLFNLITFAILLIHCLVKLDVKLVGFVVFGFLTNVLLLSGIGRNMVFIESRYLYFSSFLFVLLYGNIIQKAVVQYKYQFGRIFFTVIFLSLSLLQMISAYSVIQKRISVEAKWGQTRRKIINSLAVLHPKISPNTVFFVQCLKQCEKNNREFGISNEFVLPFSSGPGWIFLLQYAKNNPQVYASFFTKYHGKEFLWDLGSEGYRRIGNYGFGYFISLDKLKTEVKNQRVKKNAVIGLGYDQEVDRLVDITKKIQDEL